VEHDGTIAVAMPGVPREMFRMWEQEAVPRIRERGGLGLILTRTLKILGKGESAVEHDVRSFLSMTNPTIATYAKNDGVHLRISAKAQDEATAAALVADLEKKVLETVGQDVYAVDDETLGGTLSRVLGDRTFAVSDCLTGGGLVQVLTESPEMAGKFAGGLLGTSPSTSRWAEFAGRAGSAEAAAALAADARIRFSAAVGIGITGVPGPDPIDGVEPGTFAIAIDDGSPSVQTAFRSSTPAEIRRWTAYTALNLIWRKLAGRPLPT
jgi:nicotinamide-nucleotide amidase